MLNTSVLLICFNRPNHTRKVLERIVEAKPKDLYVFRDHPRDLSPQPLSPVEKGGQHPDVEKCKQVISVVKELTDGTGINVHYLLPETNLGCGAGPMTGISWFFDNVEQGIVMEDDCLAHPDFFPYCEELLNRYKGTEVKFINSTLYHDRWKVKDSYGFSHYMITGAWASWREVWNGFDLDLRTMDAKTFRKQVFELTGNKAEANWWYFAVLEIQKDFAKKSYWDFQMQIHLFRQRALTIHPAVNLISNIGFDAEGTHTWANDGRGDKEVFSIMPLTHPSAIEVDKCRDELCFAKAHGSGWVKDTLLYIYNTMLWKDGVWHELLVMYKRLKGSGYNTHRI